MGGTYLKFLKYESWILAIFLRIFKNIGKFRRRLKYADLKSEIWERELRELATVFFVNIESKLH